jgi:uncharacterized protein YgbK (DUF1537 family)
VSGRLVAFYGDDFSGSTDALEVLARAGVRSVLFLVPPTPDRLERFPEVQAIGLGGVSRSLPTERMEAELRPAFEALGKLAPLLHYKVCSTFDSSPDVGSIGRAIDVGRSMFAPRYVPLLVGAPALGRYCAFGNLFATAGIDGAVHRLDRHPTMSRHPVTPMDEADLTRLLARQTKARVALLDWRMLGDHPEHQLERLLRDRADVVLFDAFTEAHLPVIGRAIWRGIEPGRTLFAVGSSGIEYALTAYWREAGILPAIREERGFGAVDRIVAVSGSCSPVTAAQIVEATRRGFGEVALSPEEWTTGEPRPAVHRTLGLLARGLSVVVHAACGPDDPRIAQAEELLSTQKRAGERNSILGRALAAVVEAAVGEAGVRRVAVAGGDTAGHVVRALGIEALEFMAALAPGSPLCRASARKTPIDGLEVTLKGGQVGQIDFFVRAATGTF